MKDHHDPVDDRVAAELYAALHAGNTGDVDFYLQVCRGAGSVLELGCGAGRVMGPLLEAGLQVTGLDRSPTLLALAEEALPATARSRARLVEGDMTSFALERRFDRVLIPFTGLFALPNIEAMATCLEAAREHLADDGVLALDVYRVDDEDCAAEPPWETDFEPLTTLIWRGLQVPVEERDSSDGAPGRIDATYRFRLPDKVVEQTIAHRCVTWPVLRRLIRDAGFGGVEARGSFEGAPLRDDDELLVVLATP